MGSVIIRETSHVGEVSSTIEYEFSDSSDFFAFNEYKQEALNNAVKSYIGNMDFGNPLDSVGEAADNVTEIKVAKKTKETKH
jgi:hypothetical protein